MPPEPQDLADAIARLPNVYEPSDEAREGLMTLIARMVEEARFGQRELSAEDLADLARAWNELNDGMAGAEVAIDWTIKRLAAERGSPPPATD